MHPNQKASMAAAAASDSTEKKTMAEAAAAEASNGMEKKTMAEAAASDSTEKKTEEDAEKELRRTIARIAANNLRRVALLNLLEVAAIYTLVSGEMAPTDPEFKAMVAQGEELGVSILSENDPQETDGLDASSGEEMVAVCRKHDAAAAAALKKRAGEFLGFMRDSAALIDQEAAAQRERPV